MRSPLTERRTIRLRPATIALVLAACTLAVSGPASSQDMRAAVEAEPHTPAPRALGTAALDSPVSRDEYVVGPGDVLALSIWGEVNVTAPLTVTSEGTLILPVGGAVDVSRLTIANAEARVRRFLSDYYRDVDLTLSLVTPRQVIIHVTGAVSAPGEYSVSAATRVSGAIALAGGLVGEGSERLIVLRDAVGLERPVDLLRYRRLGDLSGNPLVMEGSVVHVPYRVSTVDVLGAVNAPGAYEVTQGDDLMDAVRLAGGTRPDANLSEVEFVRFLPDDPVRYTSAVVDLSAGAADTTARATTLRDGDRVFVRSIERWHQDSRVEVRGEVVYAGVYSIREGQDSLSEVIARAGGTTAAADLAQARLRRQAAGEFQTGAERQVELLEAFERKDMSYEEYAFLQSQRLELPDVVSVDFRALLVDGDLAADIPLVDGDLIEIPRALSVVRVSGAVKTPGFVRFMPDTHAEEYIGLAGGYTRDADEARVRVVKSQSGSRLRPNRGTRIEPGDIVWVPRTKERDWWEITKDVLGVAVQLATIYILIDSLEN